MGGACRIAAAHSCAGGFGSEPGGGRGLLSLYGCGDRVHRGSGVLDLHPAFRIVWKLENVQKKFQDKTVFDDFSMEIEKGDFVCLAGPSGSGKSTVLNLIGMFEEPDRGNIELFGEPQPKMASRRGRAIMRDAVFYIFQNYALVDDRSISYNLSIPLLYSGKSRREKQK